MARGAAAVAVALVEDEPARLEIKSKDLVHVLLMDDYEEFTRPLKEQLERWGYSVDVAADPIQGNEYISKQNYQIIIADMKFPEPFISGDEFLLQNKEAVRKATTIAITANRANITYEDELKEMKVIIIEKGDHIPELKNITSRTLNKVVDQLNQAVVNIVNGEPATPGSSAMSAESNERLQQILVGWLRTMGAPEKRSIFYKGRMYSPGDLIQEVETGTAVGKAHMDMMINLFEDTFKVDTEYEQNQTRLGKIEEPS